MIDVKTALNGTAAGLSLLDNLFKLIQTAHREGKRLNVADLFQRLPSEAFTLTGELVEQLEKLERSFVEAKIDTKQTLRQLQADKGWWFQKKYKLIDKFEVNIRTKFAEAARLLEDYVAIAHCREAEDLLAATFAEANQTTSLIEPIIKDENKPIGEQLAVLLDQARNLRSAFGDLRTRRIQFS